MSFALARVLLASALVLSLAAFDSSLAGRGAGTLGGLAIALAYFVAAGALSLLTFFVRSRFGLQLGAQLAVDLAAITALLVVSGGLRGGITVLYLLPLAGASLMLPTSGALFVCSLAVIALLVDAVLRGLQQGGNESLVFQTGLYGAALFAVTTLLRLLSARLAAQEQLAQARGRDLVNQLEINRLVIAQMEQGVLVVDARTTVRANNRAARQLLGMQVSAALTGQRLSDFPNLRPLAGAFLTWLQAERSSGSWSNSVLPGGRDDGPAQHAMSEQQVRARFARPPSEASAEYVIFLDDMGKIEERAQQLKLASMGRLTASIAHEIRNPLAAISHAGQLLSEETTDPLPKRLAGIVRENTQRLNRLVEDVLRVARREPPVGEEIEIAPFLRLWLSEFARDRNLAPEVVRVKAEAKLSLRFEASHLRQVLFNLVDNALRYGSGKPGAVELVTERAIEDGGRVRLWVFDDGPGVALDARAALFEPFFTTHTRGTGLGLYLAREFCIANRSDLVYAAMRQMDGSSREGFALRFARALGGAVEETGFLDTIPVR